MNELEVKEIREKMGLSQERFAKLLGVTARTVQNRESGGVILVPNKKPGTHHRVRASSLLFH